MNPPRSLGRDWKSYNTKIRPSKCLLHHLQQWCTFFRTGLKKLKRWCFVLNNFSVPFLPSVCVKCLEIRGQRNLKSLLVYLQCIVRVFKKKYFSIFLPVYATYQNLNFTLYILFGINSFSPEIMVA